MAYRRNRVEIGGLSASRAMPPIELMSGQSPFGMCNPAGGEPFRKVENVPKRRKPKYQPEVPIVPYLTSGDIRGTVRQGKLDPAE